MVCELLLEVAKLSIDVIERLFEVLAATSI